MKSPFKFLDSYTKNDRQIFFGRDRQIEELYQKVFDSIHNRSDRNIIA